MGRALSLSLIYIPSSLCSGYHGSKELDSNNATEGWSLWREERADHICVWARQGVDGLSVTWTLRYGSLQLLPHMHYYICIITRVQSIFIGWIWIHSELFSLDGLFRCRQELKFPFSLYVCGIDWICPTPHDRCLCTEVRTLLFCLLLCLHTKNLRVWLSFIISNKPTWSPEWESIILAEFQCGKNHKKCLFITRLHIAVLIC